jgi:ATP-dependent RNA helicase SUPV3L1/SUV3
MVLRGVVGLEANAALVRQAVDASAGGAGVGPALLTAPVRPTLDDLGAEDGVGLRAAVARWQAGAGGALAGHGWLRAASLAPVAAALEALARAGLLTRLGVPELWRLATLPVDDPGWVVEVGHAVAEPHRRLRATSRPGGAEDWTLEEAERVAARARGLASLANAFPGVGGLERDALLATEAAAAAQISAVLDHEVATTSFGRCAQCGRPAAPWTDRCTRCSGSRPPALRRHGGRPRPRR